MPKFFFDVDDGDFDFRDEVGDELPNTQVACREAASLLVAMAKDAPHTLGRGKLLAVVRNAVDVQVCRVQLALQIEWPAGDQPRTMVAQHRTTRYTTGVRRTRQPRMAMRLADAVFPTATLYVVSSTTDEAMCEATS